MPIIDIIIAVAILISIVVGLFRGFVKEAISIAALLVAIWAALYFGPAMGEVSQSWLSSDELQKWFGRILVFAVILSLGGLLGWGLSKMIRWSALSGMDRFLGSLFGVLRGVLLVAVAIIGGQFAAIDRRQRARQIGLEQDLELELGHRPSLPRSDLSFHAICTAGWHVYTPENRGQA